MPPPLPQAGTISGGPVAPQAEVPNPPPVLPLEVQRVDSPLRCHYRAWQAALTIHPDQVFAAYILQGIWKGFRVGFNREQHLVPARRNTPSAGEHADAVD